MVRELRQEVAELRREVVNLRQQVGYWRTMHARAVEKGEKLQREIDLLRGENRQLKDRLYGTKSEKHDDSKRSFALDDLQAAEEKPKRRRGQQPQTPGPRRRDYSHLPVVEEPVVLPPEQCVCPQCGKPFAAMSDSEDSEVVEIEVRPYRRRICQRRYRSTCKCAGVPRTLVAPLPPRLIPKAGYGISVWVHLLLEKFAAHHALGNVLDQLGRYDLTLPPGTVSEGLRRLTPLLQPIYQAFLQRNALSAYNQADETRWLVFVNWDGKTGHRWWLWAYLGEDSVVFRIAPWSVCLTAAMFSLVATLKRWDLNPRGWLTWYLQSCVAAGGKPPAEIESFLPWNLSAQRRQELASRPGSAFRPGAS